jgi:hypothetical protein
MKWLMTDVDDADWMTRIRIGPATRGDMEMLAEYLTPNPLSPRTGSASHRSDDQFDMMKVSAVLNEPLIGKIRTVTFVLFNDDDSFFLEAHDWQSKMGDAEGTLLDSLKRFILHCAIHCASARPSDFGLAKGTPDGDKQRSTKADCLRDFVEDIIELVFFLKESAETEGELPSLRDFVRSRIGRLDALARDKSRPPRQEFFAPNHERETHAYSRQACCVIMGLTDDYDQHPIFGLNDWNKDILVFDHLGDLLWKGFGLKDPTHDEELPKMTGGISDLNANYITSGPFKFLKTTRVQEHLTLDRKGYLRIYVSKAHETTAFMFQCHKIAKLSTR